MGVLEGATGLLVGLHKDCNLPGGGREGIYV